VHERRLVRAQQSKRGAQRCNPRARPDRLGREMAAKCPRAGHTSKQSEQVTRDGMKTRATRKLALDVGHQRLRHSVRRDKLGRHPEKAGINLEQPPGLLVGGPPHHHPVEQGKVRGRLDKIGNPAIEHDGQARMRGFEPVDARVIERRNFPVLARG